MTVNGSNDIFVGAGIFGDGGIDGQSAVGTNDSFITKYSSAGVKQWTRQFGVPSETLRSRAIDADSNGDIFLVGLATGGFDGNAQTGTTFDTYIVKYSSAGVKQ